MSELHQIIYVSKPSDTFIFEEIHDFLEIIRANNHKLDVSGMLLLCEGSFFQVIEGEPQTLETLFNVIKKDDRHANVVKLLESEIETRDFPDWSMGYGRAKPEDIQQIDGLNDVFKGGKCLVDIDAGKAKTLIRAFKEGKYRTN